MITEDQTGVVEFLAAPSTHGGAKVERIDTHASIVFLAGERAYKLKRTMRPTRTRPSCVCSSLKIPAILAGLVLEDPRGGEPRLTGR
jgi:hypothetical protein